MKKDARLLLQSSNDSLVLAIELFNRPSDVGRTDGVLILLDHAFELFLKAAILQRGGRIRERRDRFTIGFDKALGKCLDDPAVRFLTKNEALTLQVINGWRDQAQHFYTVISEQLLYAIVRSAISLYGEVLERVFVIKLADKLPSRVLPVSAEPPMDLDVIVKDEAKLVRDLLSPGNRRGAEARARLRTLTVMERAVTGAYEGPATNAELNKYVARVRKGEDTLKVFPGIAGISLLAQGSGPNLSLRITKKEGVPIRLVGEGDTAAAAVAVKRVDETGYYSLSFNQLAEKLSDVITRNKLTALIWHAKVKDNDQYSKVFRFGKSAHQRYAEPAIAFLREQVRSTDMDKVWQAFRRKPAP